MCELSSKIKQVYAEQSHEEIMGIIEDNIDLIELDGDSGRIARKQKIVIQKQTEIDDTFDVFSKEINNKILETPEERRELQLKHLEFLEKLRKEDHYDFPKTYEKQIEYFVLEHKIDHFKKIANVK
jgi:hypothetical protein